jgi:hypothetical protein
MKTKIEAGDEYVPAALRQVWEWKDSLYQQTRHLSTHEALRLIHERASKIARQLNLRVASFPETAAEAAARLAETPPPYGGKKP